MLHKSIPIADNHPIHAWSVADQTAMNAVAPAAGDIGKTLLKVDTGDVYCCTNNVGPVWKQLTPQTVLLESLNTAIVTDATTARTLGVTDANKYLRFTNGSAITVTVPTNATAAIAVGATVALCQAGAGIVTVAAAGGVTLNTPESLRTRKAGSVISLIKVATDTWDLMGDLY